MEGNYVEVKYFNGDGEEEEGTIVWGKYAFWEAFYHILRDDVAFRVIGDLDKWRKTVDDDWKYIRDDICQHYDKPIINNHEWFSYFEGELMRTADVAEKKCGELYREQEDLTKRIKALNDWFDAVLNERS